MEEYTNESMENAFLEGLGLEPAEDTTPAEEQAEPVTDETAEPAEEQQAEGVTDTTEPEAKPETPQTLTLTYDGKEQSVTMEEAVTLAQKGMNYDRMVKRYEDQINNSDEVQVLDFFAQMYGKTRQEYVKYLLDQRESAIAEQETRKLRQEYPDAPEALLTKMSTERAKQRLSEMETSAKQKAKAAEDERLKPWMEFAEAYPEQAKDLKSLPAEVLAAAQKGEHPISAMRAFELKEARDKITELEKKLETREATEKQNQKNKQKSIGKVTSDAAEAETDLDAIFRKALFS